MEIELRPGLKALLEEKLAAGLCASQAEVIGDALRGFRERDAAWRAHNAAEIEKGWASAELGGMFDKEGVLAELDRDIAEVEAGKLVVRPGPALTPISGDQVRLRTYNILRYARLTPDSTMNVGS